jgi:V8-like Glu-specific endopeptidase
MLTSSISSLILLLMAILMPEGTIASVFDVDQRTRIAQIGTAPYLRVGQVGTTCSGFLIGESHVVTAAKCVYDQINKKWITNIMFTPARDEDMTPFGIRDWEKVYIHQNFAGSGMSEWDFAVIQLKKPLGRSTGYFTLPSTDNYAGPIEIIGYPMDKPINTMWSSSCFANTKSNKLVYKCDTYTGMIGSPIVVEGNNGYKAYGLHTQEGLEENSGLFFSSLKRYYLNRWISENSPGGTLTNSNPMAGNEINFNNVWLKNHCGVDLNFKLKFTSTDGVLKEVDQHLSFSEEAFMFKTTSSVYHIKIEDADWVEMKITGSEWGKVIHNLPCEYPYDYWYVKPISPL